MNLDRQTPIQGEDIRFMRALVTKVRFVSDKQVAKIGTPLELASERLGQYNTVRNCLARCKKAAQPMMTEGERLQVAALAKYLVDLFHELENTPPETRPHVDQYAKTFM